MALPVSPQKRQDMLDAPIDRLGPSDEPRRHIFSVQDHHRTPRGQVVPHDEINLVDVVLPLGQGPGQDWSLPRPVRRVRVTKVCRTRIR
jgi:hypothetical protein